MTDKKVWFITGAGRGMGVDIAKAALAAGNAVVATGRDPDAVTKAVGEADDLLAVKLDVTKPTDAEAAVQAAVERFGRIDVLVNNAGNFNAGFFEELTPEQMEQPAHDDARRPDERHPRRPARDAPAALGSRHHDLVERGPHRLRVRDGLRGIQVRGRGLDGVAAAGGRAVRHPHDDRQSRLLPDRAADAGVDELRRDGDRRLRRATRGPDRVLDLPERPQSGDPAKLAQALVTIASEEPPRRRFIAGADSIGSTEQKVAELQADIDLNRERFVSLDFED